MVVLSKAGGMHGVNVPSGTQAPASLVTLSARHAVPLHAFKQFYKLYGQALIFRGEIAKGSPKLDRVTGVVAIGRIL